MNWWPLVWLAIVLASCVIELIMPQRFAICCAFPAFLSMILSLCGVDNIIQIVIFIVLSIALMISCRQYINQVAYLLKLNRSGKTLIGRQFKLIMPISYNKCGKIVVDGIIWNASCATETEIMENSVVEVVDIGFFKLIVKAV